MLPNGYWMCQGCKNLMDNARFQQAMSSMNSAIDEIKSTHQQIVDGLKAEIKDSLIAELRQEIQGGFSKLSSASGRNTFQFQAKAQTSGNGKRPLSPRNTAINGQPPKTPRLVTPTARVGNGPTPLPTVSTTDSNEERFWLYVSNFHRSVTEDDIFNSTRTSLNTNDLVVKLLKPRNRSLAECSFVSFRVGVPLQCKTQAMQPSAWPQGATFREFDFDFKRNFQNAPVRIQLQPTFTPTINEPTPTTEPQLPPQPTTSSQPTIEISTNEEMCQQ